MSAVSACPACSAAPAAEALAAAQEPKDVTLQLSLPGIHCAACISGVETVLNAHPGVLGARVNLTLKRARIEALPDVTAQELTQTLSRAGYEAHELDASALRATETDVAGRNILMRLAVAGFASMNVMLLSVAVWSGAEDATRDLFHWISAAITFPAIAFSAQPFFAGAWSALRAGRLNMDVPISLAIALALITSLWETTLSGEHAYFDAALTLTFFLLAGRYLDHRARAVARSAAEELAALEVPRTLRLQGEEQVPVDVKDLRPGDMIYVRPGARMPVDGIIREGHSELDRALLTGETLPVSAGPDTQVSAGEVNLTGPLVVEVTAAGQDSSLFRMAQLVAIAESGRSRYTSLADAAAKLYAPGVHILSALSFLGWLLYSGDLRMSLNIAAAVLIITCPCALGLAVPAVTTAASGRLFSQGLLIKNATALERLAKVDTVVLDKTGTLTTGKPKPLNVTDHSLRDLSLARALAEGSSHPLAQALAHAADQAGAQAAQVSDLREVPGFGTQAIWRGDVVRLGRASWVGAQESDLTATFLQIGSADPIAFQFTDDLRAGARELVQALLKRNISVHLLSGDSTVPVATMAGDLGIAHWKAGALPSDKVDYISHLKEGGANVLMIGDGLNDTAALTTADVSISPASALDAARVASDIVLLGTDLSPVGSALVTARKATARIKENFRIATLYNVIAVPIAIIGLATPLVAALAMSASSITVSLNALRLGRQEKASS